MAVDFGPLRAHPCFPVLDSLAEHVGQERDLIQGVEFLCLAGGRMGLPINVEIHSENATVDLFTANRILDLRPDNVIRVDTHSEFRAAEAAGFQTDTGQVAVIFVRRNHRHLYRDVTEYTARVLPNGKPLPSLLHIVSSPSASAVPPIPSTLRIQAGLTARGTANFGREFSVPRSRNVGTELSQLVEMLPRQPDYPNDLRVQYCSHLRPEHALLLERLIQVFVALRLALPGEHSREAKVTVDDFAAIRALLIALPLMPIDRKVSPEALRFAQMIFEQVRRPDFQLELPDQSLAGHRWFRRSDCEAWTGFAYNTAKKRLQELEEEGILKTTVAVNNREQGRQIHYRFHESRKPPFQWENPFFLLPEVKGLTM